VFLPRSPPIGYDLAAFLHKNVLDEFDPNPLVREFAPRPPGADDLWHGLLFSGASGIGAAVIFYALMWTLGWIIAGFAGDGEGK
jgi:hypothetical protein